MELAALSALNAYLIYLVMYASVFARPRGWASARMRIMRIMLEEDCALCVSVYTTLAMWATLNSESRVLPLADHDLPFLGALFLGPILLLVFKLLAGAVFALEVRFPDTDDEAEA